jgi:uncharacterized protein YkwD
MVSKKYSVIVLSLMLLNGCGGNSTPSTTNTEPQPKISIEGKLVDSPVEGATYKCGNIIATTGPDGNFHCEQFPIEFYIGKVSLGSINYVNDNGYVTPQTLAGVKQNTYNNSVANIAQFLQSIDDDGDIEDTIKIDPNIINKLNNLNQTIDITTISTDNLENLLEELDTKEIVTTKEAIEHLHAHIIYYYDELEHESDNYEEFYTHLNENNNKDNTTSNQTDNQTTYNNSNYDYDDNLDQQTSNPINNNNSNQTTHNDNTQHTDNNNSDQTTHNDNSLNENEDYKELYLSLINDARSEGRECGEYGYMPAVEPVTWNDKLYSASYEHSKDMALSNTFSHTGSGTKTDITAIKENISGGSSVGDRITHNGYNWHRYGENITAGTVMDEAIEAMEAWLNSPGHCKNIMNKKFKEVGMAVYYNENSHYKYYWTQDFGSK